MVTTIFRLLLLAGLLKLLLVTARPLVWAGLYATAHLWVTAARDAWHVELLLGLGLAFLLGWLYLWTATRVERAGTWWVIGAIGALVLILV